MLYKHTSYMYTKISKSGTCTFFKVSSPYYTHFLMDIMNTMDEVNFLIHQNYCKVTCSYKQFTAVIFKIPFSTILVNQNSEAMHDKYFFCNKSFVNNNFPPKRNEVKLSRLHNALQIGVTFPERKCCTLKPLIKHIKPTS